MGIESEDWNVKGGSLTVEQAGKEFDLRLDMIWGWINSGQLEFRHVTTKGNTVTKILKTQLVRLINADPIGALHLARMQTKKVLQKINTNIVCLKRMLEEFQEQKIAIETWLDANPMPK